MVETGGTRVVALSRDNQQDAQLGPGAGFEWISPDEANRRGLVLERLKGVEGRVDNLEARRDESKWWIRTLILLASVVGVAASVIVAILNRWLP